MKKTMYVSSFVICVFLGITFGLVPTMQAGPKGELTIAQIVSEGADIDADGTNDFSILKLAVEAAPSVADRLSRNGQNTVFAPTDAAFEAAFAILADYGIEPGDLLANTELLTLILNYHISPGYRESGSVLKSKKLRMRDGGFLEQDSAVLIDNIGQEAEFIATDLPASNGIIHVIDTVVLPVDPSTL
jgi:uncharacterized surface protein with fasciclin (FAS1) repeats